MAKQTHTCGLDFVDDITLRCLECGNKDRPIIILATPRNQLLLKETLEKRLKIGGRAWKEAIDGSHLLGGQDLPPGSLSTTLGHEQTIGDNLPPPPIDPIIRTMPVVLPSLRKAPRRVPHIDKLQGQNRVPKRTARKL